MLYLTSYTDRIKELNKMAEKEAFLSCEDLRFFNNNPITDWYIEQAEKWGYRYMCKLPNVAKNND